MKQYPQKNLSEIPLSTKIELIHNIQTYFNALNQKNTEALKHILTDNAYYNNPDQKAYSYIELALKKHTGACINIKSLTLTDHKTVEAEWSLTGGASDTNLSGIEKIEFNGAKIEKIQGFL